MKCFQCESAGLVLQALDREMWTIWKTAMILGRHFHLTTPSPPSVDPPFENEQFRPVNTVKA